MQKAKYGYYDANFKKHNLKILKLKLDFDQCLFWITFAKLAVSSEFFLFKTATKALSKIFLMFFREKFKIF